MNDFKEYREKILNGLDIEHTSEDTTNFERFRAKALDGFGVSYQDHEVRNFIKYRQKILNGLGVSYENDDIIYYKNWRAKVLDGLGISYDNADLTNEEKWQEIVLQKLYVIWKTVSGVMVSVSDPVEGRVKSLIADIDYNADGVSEVNMTRTGKNLAIIPQDLIANDRTKSGMTFHATSKSSWSVSGTATATTYNIGIWVGNYHFLPKGTYTVTVSKSGNVSGTVNIWGYDRVNTTNRKLVSVAKWNTPQTFTLEEDSWYAFYETVTKGATLDGEIAVQIEMGTGTAWKSSEGEYITKDLGQPVYGGTLDLISGVLTSTLNADGTEKDTPEVFNIEPISITLLDGANNIWADTGEVTVKYPAKP